QNILADSARPLQVCSDAPLDLPNIVGVLGSPARPCRGLVNGVADSARACSDPGHGEFAPAGPCTHLDTVFMNSADPRGGVVHREICRAKACEGLVQREPAAASACSA